MASDHVIGSSTNEPLAEADKRRAKRPQIDLPSVAMMRVALSLLGFAYSALLAICVWLYMDMNARVTSLEKDRLGIVRMETRLQSIERTLGEVKSDVKDLGRR